MLRFHIERFCLSCHGDALWADTSGGIRLCRLVLLLHVCMCPCAAHTNTHTDQCTVRCLWRMVVYWTSASASKEQCHPQKDSSSTPEDFAKGGERHLYNILGTARLLSPKTTWWSIWFLLTGDWMDSQRQLEGFYSQQQSHTQFMSVLVPRVYGCNHAKGKHQDIPFDYHFTCSKFGVHCLYFLFIFFAQNQDYFWSLELDQHFFIIIIWSQIQPCFNVCVEFERLLWFLYLALFLQMIRWRDCFVFFVCFFLNANHFFMCEIHFGNVQTGEN